MREADRALLVTLFLVTSGCVYIHDSRSSNVVQAEETESGELLVGVSHLDHALWELILERRAGQGGFDYDGLLADGEERFTLRQYRSMLGAIDARELADEGERAAFFVNLYNATVVDEVLSRLEESSGFRVDQDGFEFFDQPVVNLEGRLLSLNVLEHGLIRGDLGHSSASVAALDDEGSRLVQELHESLWGGELFDPRVHFLLNCASRSCPPLQLGAVQGDDFDLVAESATVDFLADPARGAGPDGISLIFDWFSADFRAAGYADAGSFIGAYRELDGVDTTRSLPYDWALNRWSSR